MSSNENLYAAITGDLIDSTKLSPTELESAKKKLTETARAIGGWKKGLVEGSPDFFRGDAWQILLTDPVYALRASILIRASLLSIELDRTKAGKLRRADSRLAVGIGTVDKVSAKRVSESVGEAFVLSGRTFDKLKPHCNMTLSVSESSIVSESLAASVEWCPTVWHLIDALVGRWTLGQAEIACLAVAPYDFTQGEIGEKLTPPKDQQTVSRSLIGAGWHAISEALLKFESLDWGKSTK